MKHLIFFLTLWISIPLFVTSQTGDLEDQFLTNLEEEQLEAIKALVLYPEEVRASILTAAQHPATISKMGILQTRSKAEFERVMNFIDEDDREDIWNLTRYPGLLSSLLNKEDKSIKDILEPYPEELKKPAKKALRSYKYEIGEIADLEVSVHNSFQGIIAPLPIKGKEAFQKLLTLPEVLTILYENLELTILIGDKYQTDPEWVLQMADSLNLEIARENAKEFEDWKTRIKDDPEALDELKELTQEYSGVGEDDDVYRRDERYDYPDERVEVVYRYYSYPYWFGYPYWFSYPRWRPYPYYLDWGFYWTGPRTIFIVGMPSPYFMHWYFHHPYHFHRYPRLSNHIFDHHYAYNRGSGSVSRAVVTWKYQNREVVSDSWLRNKNVRANFLKDYAEMNRSRGEYNARNRTDISQKEYLIRNKDKYRELNKATVNQEKTIRQTRGQEVPRKPVVKPTVKPVDRTKVPTKARPVQPTTKPKQVEKIRKASEYHKNNWEVPKRKAPTVVRPQPRPRPKTVPRKTVPRKPVTRPKPAIKKRN